MGFAKVPNLFYICSVLINKNYIMSQTKKEFALSQIAPYYKDPTTCGFDGNNCVYLSSNGNMCVAGKNMLESVIEELGDEGIDIQDVIIRYEGQDKVFKPEVVGILTDNEWLKLQSIHDGISQLADEVSEIYLNRINVRCDNLGLFTFDELKEYAEKL